MRVYELAKEFNMKSIELVNQIRKEWKLPVRTYMEVLTPALEQEIRKRLKEQQPPPVKVKKSVKKVVRKKSPPPTKATKKQEPEKKETPVVRKPGASVIRRKAVDVKPLALKPVKKKEPSVKSAAPPAPSAAPAALKSIPSLKEELRSLTLESEDFAQEEEKKKTKKVAEKEGHVKKFRASDFRKREVIFQPKKKRNLQKSSKKTRITIPKSHKRVIKFYGNLSVQELSHQMGIKVSQLVKKLKKEGLDLEPSALLDFDTAALAAAEFNFEIKNQQKTFEELAKELRFGDLQAKRQPCPPIVTVMGHVDHGKTTLLDTLRKTKVVAKEAGGITQHIGAYSVSVGKQFITFVDTPGHEAFAAMRARGAKLTDIVVIVVAADDGVSSQTLEALQHAKSAEVPILVAINKIDKPGADPEKVKQQMSENGFVPEDWGGDTIFVKISALKGEGVKELLEQILLVAEMQEIQANPKQSAEGVVIESRMEKGRGWVVDLIVKDGTLKKSQYLMTHSQIGRVRQMVGDHGKIVSSVLPGFPVEISGFDSAPQAGDLFFAIENEKVVREFFTQKEQIQKGSQKDEEIQPEELLKMHSKKMKELVLVIKADVAGSLEAIKSSLLKMASEEVKINVVHSGLGSITESDVLLAATSGGEIFGFNVRPDSKIEKQAKDHRVPLWTYTVIYELLEGVKKRAIGVLDPDIVEEAKGKAEVREIFNISGSLIAGSFVVSGKIGRQQLARLVRDGRVVHEGKIGSLRRFKDDVKEVNESFECGISLESFNDIKPGDIIETFLKKEVARTQL